MSTSDGISKDDWCRVEACAEDIAISSESGLDCSLLMSNMLRVLDDLKSRYGRLPSILATEADYVNNKVVELSLLKEAYASACEIGDIKNLAFIAASLAEYYLEEAIDVRKAKFWHGKLEEALKDFSDSYLSSVLEDVEDGIAMAEKNNGKSKG